MCQKSVGYFKSLIILQWGYLEISEINKGYETIADEYNLFCVKFWIWVIIWISNVSIVCDKLRGKKLSL